MRKMKLFWKTWIVMFCSLLLTGYIFVFSYSYLAQRNYKREQTNKLEQYKQIIYDEISKNGVQKEVLERYQFQGCFVEVTEGENIIFPKEGEGFLFHLDTPYVIDELAIIGDVNNEYLMEEIKVEHDSRTYMVTLMIPIISYSNYMLGDFVTTFIVIGVISTGIISVLYSTYFLKRIKKLNEKMQAMSKMNYEVDEKKPMGDELVELENHLDEMYLRLQKLLDDRVFFTRGATHELKTPIMAVSSMLEGMLWKIKGFEEHDYYLQECYMQMESMKKLVNEILELSQIEQIQGGQSKFCPIMEEMIALYDIIAQDRGCKILFVCDDEQLEVKMLENNLKKVLSNLLSNALKYAPENSIINIEMKERNFFISNECTKLAKINVSELCEPFVQGANAEEGHGLGLYLVKTILNYTGIELECLSENELFIVKFEV
jgi:Signal transduction histidine kinase